MIINIKEDFIKLDSLLKLSNVVYSGGMAKMLIKDGKVKVNGVTEYMRGKKIREQDVVLVDDTEIKIKKI